MKRVYEMYPIGEKFWEYTDGSGRKHQTTARSKAVNAMIRHIVSDLRRAKYTITIEGDGHA